MLPILFMLKFVMFFYAIEFAHGRGQINLWFERGFPAFLLTIEAFITMNLVPMKLTVK